MPSISAICSITEIDMTKSNDAFGSGIARRRRSVHSLVDPFAGRERRLHADRRRDQPDALAAICSDDHARQAAVAASEVEPKTFRKAHARHFRDFNGPPDRGGRLERIQLEKPLQERAWGPSARPGYGGQWTRRRAQPMAMRRPATPATGKRRSQQQCREGYLRRHRDQQQAEKGETSE